MKKKPEKVLRVDLYDKDAKMFEIIKEWLNVKSDADVVRFCIKQTYLALKEGKLSVLKE